VYRQVAEWQEAVVCYDEICGKVPLAEQVMLDAGTAQVVSCTMKRRPFGGLFMHHAAMTHRTLSTG
jgi:hypothetical protein